MNSGSISFYLRPNQTKRLRVRQPTRLLGIHVSARATTTKEVQRYERPDNHGEDPQ